ncbi:MAG: tripartite tricarboxylate transporter TctB family protein [Comamonadaceae bacterium]|nr:tripartite tricarboxylate transporter TctB family protein [Pseudomonadota bacterium]MBS0607917.1 tripartite tricarboxylate transporter TctB family protein [Pseudomonadota bacterium]MDE2414025.1 tripartite tricarboxylate transporter TctB family protein [Comamonadaceae bacterium]
MKIKSQKDFFSGLMFLVVGVAFAWGATTYTVGTGARMGPGYFPLLLGVLLAVIGAGIMLKAVIVETVDGELIGKWAWKQIFFIIAANLLFGVLLAGLPSMGIPAMGLIVAIYGLTFVSSLAGHEFKFKEVLVLATILAVGSYAAFIWGLNLQFPVWPSFIAG